MARVVAIVTALAALWFAGSAAAQRQEQRFYVPEVPEDLDAVDMYLITGGLGDEVANRFGHTAIRIDDGTSEMDVVFNWGKFSFDQPGFLWKFYQGSLTYSMGVRTFQADQIHYEDAERLLVMEKLNLSLAQKRRLFEKIAWNAIPENRDFPYQYWFKNCATIPRDYLDEVLDGQIRAKFAGLTVEKKFRDYVRDNLGAVPGVAPILDVLMNSNIDRPISAWEEMFLPAKLREHLLTMPAVDDDGEPIAGTRLLEDTTALTEYGEYTGRPFNDYLALAGFGALPLLIALGLFVAARARGVAAPGSAYRWLGVAAMLWGTVSGLLGSALAMNWLVSGHPDGWANLNLMLFWPVDFLFIAIGVALFRARGPVKDRIVFLRSGRVLAVAHLVALAALAGLAAGGVVAQDVWRVTAYFGSMTVVLGLALVALAYADAVSVAAPEPSGSRETRGRKVAAR